VNISTTITEKVSPFFPFAGDEFFKDSFLRCSAGSTALEPGSGVIIDGERGYIVTTPRGGQGHRDQSDHLKPEGIQRSSLGSDPRSDLASSKSTPREAPEAKMGDSQDSHDRRDGHSDRQPFRLTHT